MTLPPLPLLLSPGMCPPWVQSVTMPTGDIETLESGQKWVAMSLAIVLIVVVLELVRRRKLREEYSFLWFGTAALLFALAFEPRLLNLFKNAISAKTVTSALFFGALCFLMLVALQFSIRLTKLTLRNKSLSQKMAILEEELYELRQRLDADGREPRTRRDTPKAS